MAIDWFIRAWNALSSGFHRPGIKDPVDRRNAPMLQVVLLLIGITVPLAWAWRMLGTDIPLRPGEAGSLFTALTVAVMALASFLLVRRNRFQVAIRLMLAVVALQLLWAYSTNGLSAHVFEQPLQVMWLFVAGVAIGRWALWAMYAVLVASLLLGAASEARALGENLTSLLGDAAIRSAMFLVIAVVIDRTTKALRGSLDEAHQQSVRLADANTRLIGEIAERERMQAQLLHSQKVETIGHLASGIAHDFNHLLALITGYVELARNAPDDEALQRAVDGIGMAAQRAAGISHRVLDFGRYDATRPEHFDVRGALEDLKPLLRQALGPNIRLDLASPCAPCPIFFDSAQLGLAMLNLATNSAQAMAGRGDFRIEVLPDADGRSIDIRVEDDGAGIPAELQSRIFEPFFTTKPPGQGTGLGLPMVRQLVESFDGRVLLESTPGAGTRITMTLPCATLPEPVAADAGRNGVAYQASM